MHNSANKRRFFSSVEVFKVNTVAGNSAPHVEHLHWEWTVIPVLLSGMSCTISVVGVVTVVAATTTVFTH